MPIYAELYATLNCPVCGRKIEEADNRVKFQWGEMPHAYQLGDQIVWKTKRLFGGRQWCVGSPDYSNIVIVDSDDNVTTWRCDNCGALLDKPCVEIRDGTIASVWLSELGGFKSKTGYEQSVSNYFALLESSNVSPLPDFELN